MKQYDFANDIGDSDAMYNALPLSGPVEWEDAITKSRAFIHLRDAFRRMVWPDPCTAIQHTLSNVYGLDQDKITAEITFAFYYRSFFDTKFEHVARRKGINTTKSVLTISGSASRAYAATAADFIC